MGEVVEHEIPHTGKKYQGLYVVRKHRLCYERCVRLLFSFFFCLLCCVLFVLVVLFVFKTELVKQKTTCF